MSPSPSLVGKTLSESARILVEEYVDKCYHGADFDKGLFFGRLGMAYILGIITREEYRFYLERVGVPAA